MPDSTILDTPPSTELALVESPALSIEEDVRGNNWPFGGDAVIAASAKYRPEQREAVRWFFEVCHQQRPAIGMKDAARLLVQANGNSYDPTVLFRVCLGRYEGSIENFCKAIARYRKEYEGSRRASGTDAFYETEIASSIFRVCRSAMKYHRIGLITGPTQIGKTESVLEFQRRNNHGKTKYVRLPASAGVQLVMKEFASACRISRDQPFETLRERVGKAIDADHLVIVDEGEQMFATYQKGSRMKVIETIREIHDRTKCGMVIVAAPSFEDEMEDGNLAIMLAKLGGRCVFRLQLEGAHTLPREDIVGLASKAGLGAPNAHDEEFVREFMRKEGLTMYAVTLQATGELAANEKGKVTWERFRRAYDILHAGRKVRK